MKKNLAINKVFWLCLGISTMLWVTVKLPKTYKYTINFDIVYNNIPKDKILIKKQNNVNLNIQGTGFELLNYIFFKKNELNINLSNIKYFNPNRPYILTRNYTPSVVGQFSSNIEVLNFEKDTLWINFEDNFIKKIPLYMEPKLSFVKGYQLIKPLDISVDTILVSGIKSQVQKITHIEKVFIQKDKIASSFEEELNLKLPIIEGVNYSHHKVQIKAIVDKVTQSHYTINIKAINIPKNLSIKTFPKKVKVYYNVPVTEYKDINKDDFQVVLDYNDIKGLTTNYSIIKLQKFPKEVFNVQLIPQQVEYLLKNNN